MKSVVVLKCVLFSVLAFFLVIGLAPDASAKKGDSSIEVFAGIGNGPVDDDPSVPVKVDFGVGVGGGGGFGYEVIDDLQVRADISYFTWSKDVSVLGVPVTEDLRNIPIFLGGRYFFLVTPAVDPSGISRNVKLFAELGLTVNLLEVSAEAFGVTITESETKIGGALGLGAEFMVTPQVGLGVSLRYHLIGKGVGDADTVDPKFFNAGVLIAYHF